MLLSVLLLQIRKRKEFDELMSNSNSMAPQNVKRVFLFINFFSLSLSDPRISEAGLFCGNSTTRDPSYIPNFVREMEDLSKLVAADHWGHYVVNSTTPMYGLAQCFADLSPTECLLCYAATRTRLPHCLPSVSARIYLDGCFQRYDSFDFFNETVDPVRDTVNCSGSWNETAGDAAAKNNLEFKRSVSEVVDNVTRAAVSNGGFAVGEAMGVFGLAQCWKTLSGDGCRECLEKAARGVRRCVPSREGRGLNAGCYLRYSTTNFFSDESEHSRTSAGKSLSAFQF